MFVWLPVSLMNCSITYVHINLKLVKMMTAKTRSLLEVTETVEAGFGMTDRKRVSM